MRLYVVRHAEAVDARPGLTEFDRYLTADGRRGFRKTADRLVEQGGRPEVILTSPLVRAVQTAEILAERMDFEGPVAAWSGLAPGCGWKEWEEILAANGSVSELAVVGHEPDMGTLVATLLGLPARLPLRKGGIVALDGVEAASEAPARRLWAAADGEILA